jgi:hypothetical protein
LIYLTTKKLFNQNLTILRKIFIINRGS